MGPVLRTLKAKFSKKLLQSRCKVKQFAQFAYKKNLNLKYNLTLIIERSPCG